MASNNRAARRRAERDQNRRLHSQGTPQAQKPMGQHGVDVDKGDDGYIYFTLYGGYMNTCVKWSVQDAQIIAEMIEKAASGESMPEVVRDSGLVVPPPGFQL